MARLSKLLSLATLAALAVACASTPPARGDLAAPTSLPSVSTPGATSNAEITPRPTTALLDDGTCPEEWREALAYAWGYMDDLAAPRSVFPERRMVIDHAVPLVDRIPRWKPGEVARTSMAYAFALYEAAEDAHDSGDRDLEASLQSTVGGVFEQARSAYEATRDEETDPCYLPPENGASG
jgi:hypothetical protein